MPIDYSCKIRWMCASHYNQWGFKWANVVLSDTSQLSTQESFLSHIGKKARAPWLKSSPDRKGEEISCLFSLLFQWCNYLFTSHCWFSGWRAHWVEINSSRINWLIIAGKNAFTRQLFTLHSSYSHLEVHVLCVAQLTWQSMSESHVYTKKHTLTHTQGSSI